jgi:hypothetical protein
MQPTRAATGRQPDNRGGLVAPESLTAGPSGQGPITAGANIDESVLDLTRLRLRPTRLVTINDDHSESPAHEESIPLRATAQYYASHAIRAPGFWDTALVRAIAVICTIHYPDPLAFTFAQTALALRGGVLSDIFDQTPKLDQSAMSFEIQVT